MQRTCCVTGHRNIPKDKLFEVSVRLEQAVLDAIGDGFVHFISGFADGADLLFAEIVVRRRLLHPEIRLEAALPYQGRVKCLSEQFHALLVQCDVISVHSEVYTPECFFTRNRFMVDMSTRVIAVYDGREGGGTYYTVNYAHARDRDVVMIDV